MRRVTKDQDCLAPYVGANFTEYQVKSLDKRTHIHTEVVAVKMDQVQSSELTNPIKDLNAKLDNLHFEVQQVEKEVESKFTEKNK